MTQRDPSEFEEMIRRMDGPKSADSEAAWERFVALFSPVVCAVARARVPRDDLVTDVAQQVFAAVSKGSRPPGSTPGDWTRWLRVLARNHGIKIGVAESRRAKRDALYSRTRPESHAADPGGAMELREDFAPVLLALDKLSGEDRTVVAMKCLEGLACKAIAQALGELEGTIRSRLSRALAELRTILAAEGTATGRAPVIEPRSVVRPISARAADDPLPNTPVRTQE